MPGGYSKKLALRLDAQQYAAYEGTPPTRPEWTTARAALVALSAVLVLIVSGLALLGGWLVVRDFPSFFSIVAGIPVLLVAWALRPRLWSAEDVWHELHRDDAPVLFALLDRIATAAGTRMPDRVALDADFNASAGTHGWLRKRTLTIGLPLFGVLTPQQRVAVLGHEFGHFVNGDPARGLLTQPAVRTPLILADLVRPSEAFVSDTLWGQLAERAMWPFQMLLQRLFLLIGSGVIAVAARDHQRAEYCADALAVRLAGTAATEASMIDLASAEQLMGSIAAVERGTQANAETARRNHPGAARWREAADAWRASADVADVLDRSVTEKASLWHDHPPAGLRARIVKSWPYTDPSVVLSDADSARIDAELHRFYARAGRDIAWSAA
ncbi:M48 family metallopeptidase [Lentzea sp. BCCO 10_0856]|uniref:M48 family metallopeptidase n=1 Tax=Lentzea miocenica TaxID=3095431 RepID=A0ABU4T0Z4_9PSEU|nr:M48 family metallopeptidase [Lentzea sp. BCCO 10_0856]MDX8031813.1 M48 family metallopeptidase [Lentzea sp. BCCO 10_0856]